MGSVASLMDDVTVPSRVRPPLLPVVVVVVVLSSFAREGQTPTARSGRR